VTMKIKALFPIHRSKRSAPRPVREESVPPVQRHQPRLRPSELGGMWGYEYGLTLRSTIMIMLTSDGDDGGHDDDASW